MSPQGGGEMKALMLVGSIPLETAADVFEQFGEPLGPYLRTLPDGEVGPRRYWVSRVHYQVFALHPDFEVVRRPRRDDGVERLVPHDDGDTWQFRLRDGVERVVFGEPGWRLGFALDALNSYAIFRAARDKGTIPAGVRFQVSLPTVNSTCAPRNFPNRADLDKLRPGYTQALKEEIATLVRKIPNEDLAIQFDMAREVIEINGGIPDVPVQGTIETNLPQLRELAPGIPEGVELGYHFCFGTIGGWPRFAPKDLAQTVRFANAVIEASGRRVDWIHIPLLDTAEEAFFAPLAELKPRDARVYLGAVHHMERFRERVAIARRFLPEFGVAAYCGFGRSSPGEMPRVLREHLQAIKEG